MQQHQRRRSICPKPPSTSSVPALLCTAWIQRPTLPSLQSRSPLQPVHVLADEVALHPQPPQAGESVSYGGHLDSQTETVESASPASAMQTGSRAHSSPGGQLLIRGKHAPIRGAICMDTTMIDLTEIPDAQIGDVITIIGSDRGQSISAWDVARQLNTIPIRDLHQHCRSRAPTSGRPVRLRLGAPCRQRDPFVGSGTEIRQCSLAPDLVGTLLALIATFAAVIGDGAAQPDRRERQPDSGRARNRLDCGRSSTPART